MGGKFSLGRHLIKVKSAKKVNFPQSPILLAFFLVSAISSVHKLILVIFCVYNYSIKQASSVFLFMALFVLEKTDLLIAAMLD